MTGGLRSITNGETKKPIKKYETETIYTAADLHHGKCEWCDEESDEIVNTEDGEKSSDCIEKEKFCQETMRGI